MRFKILEKGTGFIGCCEGCHLVAVEVENLRKELEDLFIVVDGQFGIG